MLMKRADRRPLHHPARARRFTPAAVEEHMVGGQAALDSFLAWAPAFWHEGATSNTHRALVQDKLLPSIAQREGCAACAAAALGAAAAPAARARPPASQPAAPQPGRACQPASAAPADALCPHAGPCSIESLIPEFEYEVLKAHYVPQLPQYMPAGVMAEGVDGAWPLLPWQAAALHWCPARLLPCTCALHWWRALLAWRGGCAGAVVALGTCCGCLPLPN
jgi:hypothetical protein